jgi:hypothetical protein
MQQVVHYSLHFIFPLTIALFLYRHNWKRSYLIFLLTMFVDLDHLFATPVFDACRCSINFHPLHSIIAIFIYTAMLLITRTRIIGLGLLMHMLTDAIDCIFIMQKCN